MTYATLMVHLQVGQPNGAVLLAAAGLAGRFDAGVIGVAACQPMQLVYSGSYIAGDAFEQDREQKDREFRDAEAAFRAAFRDRGNMPGNVPGNALEWRSTITLASPSAWVANEARCADLVVTGAATSDLFDPGHHLDTGELVMLAGRPVLVVPSGRDEAVPPGADSATLDHAMIAWKDTRETRRAVLDALPLLKRLARVSVVEAAAKEDMAGARQRVADVAAWLARHGIAADAQAVHRDGDDARQLDGLAQERGADLVVAGAYGHSRVREWALGGVTRSLLLHSRRCSLLSH